MMLEESIQSERGFLRQSEANLRNLGTDEWFAQPEAFQGQHGEVHANIMLAVRHIEDARMRLGKALQYMGDGVSKFDKKDQAGS